MIKRNVYSNVRSVEQINVANIWIDQQNDHVNDFLRWKPHDRNIDMRLNFVKLLIEIWDFSGLIKFKIKISNLLLHVIHCLENLLLIKCFHCKLHMKILFLFSLLIWNFCTSLRKVFFLNFQVNVIWKILWRQVILDDWIRPIALKESLYCVLSFSHFECFIK